MKQGIRIIVANTDESVAPELRAFLLGIEGVKIVAEVDEPAMLEQAVAQFPAEVLLLHLDPTPDVVMRIAAPVIEANKDRIAAIAMTEDRNADLVVSAMRAGMREFLWKPFNPDQLAEVLRRVGGELLERRSASGSGAAGRVVSLFGTLGGVGTTAMATNLAVELAQGDAGQDGVGPRSGPAPRVALIDLDLNFGQVATYLDAQPNYTIADLCETVEHIDASLLERAMHKHPTGVHILARPATFAQAEQITAAHCAGVMSALQENYEYLVVDGLKRIDATARTVFQMSDLCILVLQMLVPAVRNADRIMHELRQQGFNMERLRLACNRFGRDAGYLEPSDVEASLSRKIDFYVPDEWKVSSTAVNMGSPILAQAPKSKLRAAYRQIAAAITSGGAGSGDTDDGASDSGRKGLFSFFAGAGKS